MISINTSVPIPTNPALIDIAIAEAQQQIKNNLSWLNYSFGRAQRLVTRLEKKDYYYPGVYITSNQYHSVLPDVDLGNFSFFIVDDPVTIIKEKDILTANISWIVWVNLDSIFPGNTDRNTEALKFQMWKVINSLTTASRFKFETVFEKAENIYKEYSIREIDTQFLMNPFAGFRFFGNVIMPLPCQ